MPMYQISTYIHRADPYPGSFESLFHLAFLARCPPLPRGDGAPTYHDRARWMDV